jgi:hypothetical protein
LYFKFPHQEKTMSTVRSSQQYLSELTASCEQILDDTQHLCSGLSEQQLNWKPAPDSWSVAQCLDHLITTNTAYYNAFESLVPTAGKSGIGEERPYRASLLGRLMIWTLQPGRKIKMRAPSASVPSQSTLPRTIVDDFIASNRQLMDYMRRSRGLDISSIPVTSPLSSLVRLNLGDAYGIIVTHTQRHLLQAKRVVQREGFPA